MARLLLRGARWAPACGAERPADVVIEHGVVSGASSGAGVEVDLGGRLLLPAFVNAFDVLDVSSYPPLGRPPHASLYEWTRACEAEGRELEGALAVPLAERLFLGGLRNLLAGVGSALHHHPDHRSLAREDFPIRVQRRYSFAHSPGLTPDLRRSYRTSDRRVPWIVRAAEGRDPALRGELDALASANVLRQNTVVARGTALEPEDAARLAAAKACLVWCPESDLRLYGRTPRVVELRARGVRIGLGSDGAAAGARDFLSSLGVARRVSGLDGSQLVELATRSSAEVARLPLGGCAGGSPADLLATGSLERLLDGDRRAVALLVVRGRVAYGEPALVEQAGAAGVSIRVDGEPRVLVGSTGSRFASLLRRHPALRRAAWLERVAL